MSHQNILDPGKTALIVVDIQEGFRNAIPDFAMIASRASTVVRGFQALDLPVLITEQYPKGLGRTAEEVQFILPNEFEAFSKTAFSSCGSDLFLEKLNDLGIRQVVLCGLETHVCVSQTAHDLIENGLQVQLLIDVVGSRFDHDKRAGLEKMNNAGVISSSVEMVFFELMRDAKHEKFKEIQGLIK